MAGSAKKILFTHFQELQQEELDDLCSLLETRLPAGGRSEVPKGRSRKAEYMALACRLIDRYGEAQALAVAADLLGQIWIRESVKTRRRNF